MLTYAVLVMASIAHAAYMIQKLTMLHIPIMPRACEVSSLDYYQLQDAQQLRQHVQSALHPAASALHELSATLQAHTLAGKARDLTEMLHHTTMLYVIIITTAWGTGNLSKALLYTFLPLLLKSESAQIHTGAVMVLCIR
jgi:hypothetical protein